MRYRNWPCPAALTLSHDQVIGETGRQYLGLPHNSTHTRSENQHEPQPRPSWQHTFTFKDTSDYCQSFDPPDRLVVGERKSSPKPKTCSRWSLREPRAASASKGVSSMLPYHIPIIMMATEL